VRGLGNISRVVVVVGTRPEAIKMSPLVLAFDRRPERFERILLSTGQHREMLDQALEDFGLKPDDDLGLMTADQSLPVLTSAAMTGVARAIDELKPDALLVQGDTTTAMVAALAAFYAGVPVGHVEAGLRTGDRLQPFPEEINRRLISSLATWHYAPTQTAVDALLREGTDPASVVLTGNTVVDALLHISASVGDVPTTTGRRLLLVTAHRRESLGEPMRELCLALLDVVRRNPDVEVVYPVHMNPRVRETVFSLLGDEPRIHLTDPVSYRDLVILIKRCYLVLTDSGGIQEEAPVFGKPVLVLREVTERPEAVTAGTVKIVGTDRARIVAETERLLRNVDAYAAMARAVSPYGDGMAAERIINHLSDKVPRSRQRPLRR
jgi:UDP-N-acetylglucosamine 2-epimerase (non-hydrolysing)